MGVWNIASKHWKGRHPLSANSGCLEGALEESGGVNLDIAICKLPLPVSFPLIPTASWTLRISFIELGLHVGNEVFMKFDSSSSVAELRSPCRSVLVQPPHHPPWGISPTPFPSGCLHVWTWAWSCCGVLLPCPLAVTTLILPFSVMASLVSLLFPPPIWMMADRLASSLILSCDSHHPGWKSLLLHVFCLAQHQSWKRLLMTRWTFSACKLRNGTNDFISVQSST